MSTKLGLLSDIHATTAPVEEAMAIFKREQVDLIICPGDIAGYFDELEPVVDLLIENDCRTVMGNHDQAYLESHAEHTHPKAHRFLEALPDKLEFTLEGKHVYVVHAHPPDSLHGGIKLLDVDGQLLPEQKQYWQAQLSDFGCDALIVGHTHQVFVERLGGTLVINPGSTRFNHTCMILNLPEMRVETFALEGKKPLKSWNWGKFIHNQ